MHSAIGIRVSDKSYIGPRLLYQHDHPTTLPALAVRAFSASVSSVMKTDSCPASKTRALEIPRSYCPSIPPRKFDPAIVQNKHMIWATSHSGVASESSATLP